MVTNTAKWAGTVAVDLAEPPKTSQKLDSVKQV